MRDLPERNAIEQEIVRCALAVNTVPNPPGGWLNDDEIDEFIDAWEDLILYYQGSKDFVVDIEVVREYHDFLRRLFDLVLDPELEAGLRERASEVLEELQGQMDELLKEAITNKHA